MYKPWNDARHERIITISLALPETTAGQTGPMGQHMTFSVRGKNFVDYVVNEHSDGRIALLCKAAPGVQGALVASQPARYFVPKYIGPSGWVALDLDAGKIIDESGAVLKRAILKEESPDTK